MSLSFVYSSSEDIDYLSLFSREIVIVSSKFSFDLDLLAFIDRFGLFVGELVRIR